MDGSGAWYDEVALGDSFGRTVTVTDTHLVLGAGLIGDGIRITSTTSTRRGRASGRESCTAC